MSGSGVVAAVKQILEHIWPMLAQVPDVSAVKDAAGGTSPLTRLR